MASIPLSRAEYRLFGVHLLDITMQHPIRSHGKGDHKMKLSRTVAYAVQASLHLAHENSSEPVPCSRLAAEGQMPERFLLQILRNLVAHGILTSTRGVDGGYSLVRDPEDISLLDIIEAIDGPLVANLHFGDGLPSESQSRLKEAISDSHGRISTPIGDNQDVPSFAQTGSGIGRRSRSVAGIWALILGVKSGSPRPRWAVDGRYNIGPCWSVTVAGTNERLYVVETQYDLCAISVMADGRLSEKIAPLVARIFRFFA